MTRTLSVPVVSIDESLATFAASIDAAVDAACADLEGRGFEILATSPVTMRTSQDEGDASKSHWTSENGVIVMITYRGTTQAKQG